MYHPIRIDIREVLRVMGSADPAAELVADEAAQAYVPHAHSETGGAAAPAAPADAPAGEET
jgi:hypothetical protein